MKRLEEIRERLNKATPGPWDIHRYSVEDWNGNQVCGDFTHEEDKAFIFHAPDDIKYLLEQFTALQEENEKLKDQLEDQTARANIGCGHSKIYREDRDRLFEENAALKKALEMASHKLSEIENLNGDEKEIAWNADYDYAYFLSEARSTINSKEGEK
jgi:cell division septum initiation protein DivIVA